MNEFKTSQLNKKYSIPVHKNRADLMAELNNINIMGDESDVEIIEPPPKDNDHNKNGLIVAKGVVGDANGSKFNGRHSTDTSVSSETSDSSSARRDGEPTDDEPVLAWAQNNSHSLSVCVQSILSDHDYLSQENLLGIITSMEESFELEQKSHKQREINDNVPSNSTLQKDPTTDSQKTIIYRLDTKQDGGDGVTAAHSSLDNEKTESNGGIDDLNDIFQKLKSSKNEEKSALFDQILERVNQLKLQTVGCKTLAEEEKKDSKEKSPAQNQSNNGSSEFSPNHSEPMEYYGGPKFSTQSSIEEAKECDDVSDVDVVQTVQNDLKFVEDIALRISADTKSIRNRLSEIEKQPEKERIDAIREISQNFGLLVEDMANQLNKTAKKLNPKKQSDTKATQTSPNKKARSWSSSISSTGDELSDSGGLSSHRRLSRKMKRRRKVPKSRASVSAGVSSNASSNSEDLPNRHIKDEPLVISQDVDDLMNGGGASNSANESLSKENDLLGFDHVDDEEVGIKTAMLSQDASNKDSNQNIADRNENSIPNESNEKPMDVSINSALEELNNQPALSPSGSADHLDDDDEDDEDEEIQKLLDFKSIENRQNAKTSTNAKLNGIVQSAKKTIKKPEIEREKENELQKFLEKNSDDTEKTGVESDEENSEPPKEKEKYTEEQYLEEQNRKLKEQLLESSSESDANIDDSDDDDDDRVNGKESESSDLDDDDDKSKTTSESDESLVTKFLASEDEKSPPPSPSRKTKKADKANENNESSKSKSDSNEEEGEGVKSLKTKETPEKSENIEKFDVDTDIELDSDIESVQSDVSPKKSKTIGKNLFANITKDIDIALIDSDDDDDDDDEKTKRAKRKKKESTDANSSVEILDTSMFKAGKKDYNPHQLSRILQSNRSKQSTSQPQQHSPECISLSSDDDIEIESTVTEKKDENEDDDEKEKRVKRKLLRPDQLADDTKQAQKEEQERIKRLDKKNERLTQFIESQRESQEDTDEPTDPNEVVLDIDSKTNKKIVVHPEITKHLKPHQVEGLKFMYDCCYGSVDNLDKYPGSGCILAHCMGLGKTLQLISLLHTVICQPKLKTDKVLVICPKSTVMNWKDEIERWLGQIKSARRLKLYHFPESSDIKSKLKTLKDWSQCGGGDCKQAGCLMLGYEAFRTLVFYHNSKKSRTTFPETELERLRKKIHEYLLDPGADLVVCDEGHMIKNQKSTTAIAVNKIMTKRRIVLTGTPIQNNLKEYYSMVNFIKPSFLGTEKEFANLYVNPIKNGQHKDSSKSEIKYMKQRSYVLHKKLSKFVQRKEAALLKSFLPDKFEYVLFIPMTDVQTSLYEYFLENRPNQDQKGKSLIPDYTVLRKIWTHPKVLENAYLNAIRNKTRIKPLPAIAAAAAAGNINDSDDDQPDDVFDSQTGEMSVTNAWWRPHLKEEDLGTIMPSNKMKILFEILNQCRLNKEKCLIFSAFVAVLDVVEYFMHQIHDQKEGATKPGLETFRGPWEFGKDYYRLDGKTAKNQRHSMITNFNDPKNVRTRVFLISAKAGGQGINLIGANRVVLLDTSWNPSNDQQNIFRVFRLGQKRICYIYRLLSMGTMEEKVYSRSVTKQAMSCRVMDVQQIDRHYNMAELTELYTLTKPNMAERPTPNLPKDGLLAHLLMRFPQMVYKYHEHDSLLENKGEEELSEQEKNDAWAAYEEDVKRKNETNMGQYNNSFGMLPNYSSALGSYANSLYNNYNNLSGVSGLNYPYNMYNQYPYANDSHWQFNDYTSFYNNLMTMGRSSMNNAYNQSSTNLLSPNNTTSAVSSPPPSQSPSSSSLLNMSNFTSARNWMQQNASASSGYTNSLLSSLATSSATKNSYASYLNSLYNALGPNATPAVAAAAAAAASTSTKTPPPMTSNDFNPLTYLQKQNLSNIGATSPIGVGGVGGGGTSSALSLTGSSSGQQGPNAMRNPLLTKELTIPRNPLMSKDLFNVPVVTSVITKTTTSTSSTLSSILTASSMGSNALDASKSNQTSPDANISSSLDKNGSRIKQKSPFDGNNLIIKDVRTINNESRESPDTTGSNNRLSGKSTNVSDKGKPSTSNDVSSTVDGNKKTNKAPPPLSSSSIGTPVSTNMGIVYPAQKNASTVLVPIDISKAKDKEPSARKPLPSTSGLSVSKSSNQPMPSIIRKPPQSNAKPSDAANDAVAAINKNKALTVTARSVATTIAAAAAAASSSISTKTPPVPAGVNNTFTLSPILPAQQTTNSVTITPQLVQQTKANKATTSSQLSKANTSSPIPIALTKANLNQTTITKSPSPVSKPNGLGFRSTNTTNSSSNMTFTALKTSKAPNAASTVPSNTRQINNNNNNNRGGQPKILVSTQTSQSKAPYKPIVAQTKTQMMAGQNVNKRNANVVSKTLTPQQQQQQSTANTNQIIATKLNSLGVEMRKRPANETIPNATAKKSKTDTPTSSTSGTQKAQNPLQGIRMSQRSTQSAAASQITPVEIVELE